MNGAIDALGELKDPDAIRPLLELAGRESTDRYSRYDISKSLSKIKGPDISALLDALRGNNLAKKSCAVDALYGINAPEAVDLLINTLKDDNFDSWLSTIYVLGKYRDPSVKEKLRERAKSSLGNIKVGVACALGLMKDPEAAEYIVESFNQFDFPVGYSPRVEEVALKAIGAPAVPQLIKALHSSEYELRWIAAEALIENENRDAALKDLISALKDSNEAVRWTAAEALEKIASPDSADALVEASKDSEYSVRCRAIEALYKTGDPRIFNILIKALNDPEPIVWLIAARKLGEMKDKRAIKPLLAMFESKDPERYGTAAEALSSLDEGAYENALIMKIRNEKLDEEKTGREIKRDAIIRLASALTEYGKSAPVIEMVRATTWQVRYIGGMALKGIETPESHRELVRAFNERDLDIVAGGYIYFIEKGYRGSEPVLARALNDYSDYEMAAAFYNCGNRKMKKAGLLDSLNKHYCLL